MARISFNIPDLHCEGCANRSTKILENLEGVQEANVSFENKTAEVRYDADRTGFEEMKDALTKANYTAEQLARD